MNFSRQTIERLAALAARMDKIEMPEVTIDEAETPVTVSIRDGEIAVRVEPYWHQQSEEMRLRVVFLSLNYHDGTLLKMGEVDFDGFHVKKR